MVLLLRELKRFTKQPKRSGLFSLTGIKTARNRPADPVYQTKDGRGQAMGGFPALI